MPMPWQLRNAQRPKRATPRPLAECLQRINVNDLKIPKGLNTTVTAPRISLRFPFLSGARLSARMVEFAHSGRIQSFRLKWIKTGYGLPRFAFICDCGRPVISLYLHHGNLSCRRCGNAIYASQVCDKHSRPTLKAIKLRNFLNWKTYMSQRNRQRIEARLSSNAAQQAHLNSKRLSHEHVQRPSSNYSTRGLMHWR